jgi:hypothetical protein
LRIKKKDIYFCPKKYFSMTNLLQKNSLFDLKLYALNQKKMIIIINPTCKNKLSGKGFRGFLM